MPLRQKQLHKAKLYIILDTQVNSGEEIVAITEAAAAAGDIIVQLRDKRGSAREILTLAQRLSGICSEKILFFINDRADIAVLAQADGVHLGQDDLPVTEARAIMGADALIGCSCQSLKHVRQAVSDGADYIGFGSVYQTMTKPERSAMDPEFLRTVCGQAELPLYAIGGITLERIRELKALGVDRFAVCRDICDNVSVSERISQFKSEILNGVQEPQFQ